MEANRVEELQGIRHGMRFVVQHVQALDISYISGVAEGILVIVPYVDSDIQRVCCTQLSQVVAFLKECEPQYEDQAPGIRMLEGLIVGSILLIEEELDGPLVFEDGAPLSEEDRKAMRESYLAVLKSLVNFVPALAGSAPAVSGKEIPQG